LATGGVIIGDTGIQCLLCAPRRVHLPPCDQLCSASGRGLRRRSAFGRRLQRRGQLRWWSAPGRRLCWRSAPGRLL